MPGSKKDKNLIQDPTAGVIANLFGLQVFPSGRGGFKIGLPQSGTQGTFQFADPIFGDLSNLGKKAVPPNLDLVGGGAGGQFLRQRAKFGDPLEGLGGSGTGFSSIGDLLNPTPLNDLQLAAEPLGALTLEKMFAALGLLEDTLLPGAVEGATTGFRTDLQPIIDQQLGILNDEIIPGLNEQFAGQTGSFSTDFLAAQLDAGGDVTRDLGALQFQADEAAAGRRLEALPLAQLFNQARVGLPTAVGRDLFELGSGLRREEETARPGFAALNLLRALQGNDPFRAIPSDPGISGVMRIAGGIESASRASANFGSAYGSIAGGSAGCWVAAEYFGWATPQWWDARRWITRGWRSRVGRLFKRLYLRHGEWLAGQVRRKRVVRWALKPLFTWAARKGGEMHHVQ